jgi:hypothetical protein
LKIGHSAIKLPRDHCSSSKRLRKAVCVAATRHRPSLSGLMNAGTSDVIQVGADYGIWDYSQNQAVDVNSTTFKDPA